MSKRILWILTIGLSLSMLGLIFVQIKWIQNAIELKDIQFQQLVNNTLTVVTRQIDEFYASSRMDDLIEGKLEDDVDAEWDVIIEDEIDPEVVLDKDARNRIKVKAEQLINNEDLVEIISDTILVITEEGSREVDTININQYHDHESQKKLEESLRKQEFLVATIMKKMLLEDVPFDKRVSQKQLEKFLSKNLTDRGIDLEYEYTVIADNRKEIYQSDDFTKNTDCYYFRSGLLNDDISEGDTYLYLYFPGQKALVRGSLGFLGPSTIGLTLLMIILFSFALYVIFRQKKLSDIKNDFVNNMTHELKTPISTISLASQMLNDDTIPQDKKNAGHISRIIQTESKRLGFQVERVLQMAVLDQGHLILKKMPVSMKDIVPAVIQNFKLQVESRNGKLEFVDESDNYMVYGDKVHLMNVVTNLLDNAVKYSKETPEILVKVLNNAHNFRLIVKDNGIGISKENQKKIFERFYRVSTGNVHDVKGFGLGLSYVKLIVDQHGGKIDISSELNKGTKFEIVLPKYSERKYNERY